MTDLGFGVCYWTGVLWKLVGFETEVLTKLN